MKVWPVQDAKARFSELLDACVREGPQVVTRRGAETAVLVSVAEWKRLCDTARPSLKELLLSASASRTWRGRRAIGQSDAPRPCFDVGLIAVSPAPTFLLGNTGPKFNSCLASWAI